MKVSEHNMKKEASRRKDGDSRRLVRLRCSEATKQSREALERGEAVGYGFERSEKQQANCWCQLSSNMVLKASEGALRKAREARPPENRRPIARKNNARRTVRPAQPRAAVAAAAAAVVATNPPVPRLALSRLLRGNPCHPPVRMTQTNL